MKILVIAFCNTPHQNGLLIAREMKTFGHDVEIKCLIREGAPYEYPLKPGSAKFKYELRMIDFVKQFKPDCIFVTSAGIEPKEFFERLSKVSKTKLILWNADAYVPGTDKGYWNRYKGVFDLIITSVEGMVRVLQGYAKNIVFLPQYYDQTYYNPTIERLDPNSELYDVCFVGNTQKGRNVWNRENYIKSLREFCKIKVVGYIPEISNNVLYGIDMANVYCQSKITFDTPHIIQKEMGWKISDRIFKAMGCGCFFICPPMSGLYRFFIPGKHLVTYDGSIDDLKAKVKYYLEHEEEREEIAKNGQIEILKNHTITTRVIQYINAIKEIV